VLYRIATTDDAAPIAAVHVESWRSTYVGLLPAGLLARLSVEARATYWKRQLEDQQAANRTYICVVEDESGRVVGFASAGAEREPESGYDGELFAIYLLAEQQGAGIGTELVRRVVAHLLGRGHASMRVWVLAGNPAEKFYRRLGGVKVAEKPIEIGGDEYQEIAYGWRDLAGLTLG